MMEPRKTLNLLAPGVDEEEMAKKADLVDGKVPASQLPSYVDDVVEYASTAEFPNPGEQGKIYVALDSGFTYRWSGSEYIQIGGQDLSGYYTKDEADQLLETKQPVGDYATNSALEAGLATKQDVGDYATNTALTEGLATKQPVGDYATNSALETGLATKQDNISDLDTIRAGAALGATAVQPTDVSTISELDIRRLFRTEYSISTTVLNGVYSGDSSIWTGETASVNVAANTGYKLPDEITVEGADYTYAKASGLITLSNAVSNVAISVTCKSDAPTPGDMPNKGDMITLNGESDRYRVLKVNGNIAQLMRLGNYQSSVFSSGATTTFDNGSTGLKYADSTLDTLLNTTYYNSLSTNIKNAIVEESRIQNMYDRSDRYSPSADFRIKGSDGTWYSHTKTDQTTIGNRKVYALNVSEIAEYLGTDIGYADLLNMFFEQTTTLFRFVWTSSAYASISSNACYVLGNVGYLGSLIYRNSIEVFPAFSIDLSQVTWQVE